MIKRLIATLMICLLSYIVVAKEVHYLARSPRALLMGDANYSLAGEDEYTLYYNPAALGSHKGITGNLLNPDLSVTNVMDSEDLDRFSDFPKDDPAGIANRVMGFPMHIHAGITPSFKMASFGFSTLFNWTNNMVLRNSTSPVLDIDWIYDRGFVVGGAVNLINRGGQKKKRGRKQSSGLRLSVGAAVKHIKREALQGSFALFGTTLLNAINNRGDEGFSKVRNELGYSKGDGWGADAGVEFQYSNGGMTFTSGLSAMDIGHTNFKKVYGTRDIPRQEMMVNWGNSFKYDLGILETTFSLDFHPLNSYIDFSRKTHFGVSLDMLGIGGFYGGWNAGYLSYGVSLNIYFMKLLAGFYSVELGTERRDQEGKRIIIYLSLLDFSFEP